MPSIIDEHAPFLVASGLLSVAIVVLTFLAIASNDKRSTWKCSANRQLILTFAVADVFHKPLVMLSSF